MKTILQHCYFLFVFILIANTNNTYAQTTGCPNADFSAGNFSNWTALAGTYTTTNGANLGLNPVGAPIANRHTVITAQGTDPNTGNQLQLIPPGYTASARISGNNVSNGLSSGLSYTMTVTPQNALFIYNYAVVLQDPGHSATEQPKFQLSVRDQNNNPVPCTFYDITASRNLPGWTTNGAIVWKNWTKVGIDLSSQMGNTVTISAGVAGCVQSQGAHWGYAYVVAECQAMEVDVRYCVGDTSAVLVAPNGFESYQWSTGSTSQSLVVNNPQPGTTNYTVTVTSNNGACVATLPVSLTPIVVTADFNATPICNEGIAFQDASTVTRGSITRWQWQYGDGSPIDSSSGSPSHYYPGLGPYNVTLIAISQAGCKDTITKQVTPIPDPVADFDIPGVCGLTSNFTDLSYLPAGNAGPITSWNWSFGTGNTSTQQNPTFTYPNSGTWNVRLIVTDARGCRDTSLQVYRNLELPVASFTAPAVCYGDSTVFTNTTQFQNSPLTDFGWSFGDGNSSLIENPTHRYFAPGDYNVTFIVENSDGCADTITQLVSLHALPQVSFTNTDVCERLSSVFTDNSTISQGSVVGWNWNFDHPNLANSSSQNPTVLYPDWGHYNVKLIATSNNGCRDSLTKLVNIWPRPDIDFVAAPLAGCYPFDAVFTNNTTIPEGSIFQYQWTYGDGGTSGIANPTYVYPNRAGNYTVKLYAISDKGCDDSLVRVNYITVWPAPEADFSFTPPYPTELNSIVQFHNHSVGAVAYAWDFNNGDNSSLEHPFVDFGEDTTTYIINLISTNEYGCADTAQQTVIIRPEFNLYIPNSFTPNNDKTNDNFVIVGRGVRYATLMIFNRWGQHLVTLSGDQPFTVGWDGTYNGERVKPDVYSYKLQVRDAEGITRDFHGNINLLR